MDEFEEAFHGKAVLTKDVAAGALLVKIAERRATLLGLNPPLGHAVRIVLHVPEHRETNTDRIERMLRELIAPPKAESDEDKLN